jgi:hypothetical protein
VTLERLAPGLILQTLPQASLRGLLTLLTCYLDDSDNDTGPVLVLAGYYGKPDDFSQFEIEADQLFKSYGVDVLHTMKFHHGRGVFKDWGRLRKEEFVRELYAIIYSCALNGVCGSVRKSDFKSNLKPLKQFSSMSPLGYAFSKIVYGMTAKLPILDKLPLSFVVESGNSNNGNLVKYFHFLQKEFAERPNWLGSISFISKTECKAIQIADFFAFYGRKIAQQWDIDEYPNTFPDTDYASIILERGTHHFERSYGQEHDGGMQPGGLLPGISVLPGRGGL